MPKTQTRSHEMLVHFYDARALWPHLGGWRRWVELPFHVMISPENLLHVAVEFAGLIFHCNAKTGCTITRLVNYPPTPCVSLPVFVNHVSFMDFATNASFQYWRSLWYWLGLQRTQPMNCVQATARMIGVTRKVHSPAGLFYAITEGAFDGRLILQRTKSQDHSPASPGGCQQDRTEAAEAEAEVSRELRGTEPTDGTDPAPGTGNPLLG